jgi:23S rRNA-/tRNA-specific pseudouridylate synthase
VIERLPGMTLLHCFPLTGRQHQVRVHLQSIGLPLLVDPLYGNSSAFYLSSVKPNYRPSRRHEERPLIDRLTLHAEALSFTHPRTGEPVCVEAPLPKDFRATLTQLRRLGHR